VTAWEAVNPWPKLASQLKLHSIVGNTHVDATLGGHGPEIAGDNLPSRNA
jgi:hypothetical protein